MISDVLSDALDEIRRYLDDEVTGDWYVGALRQRILALTDQMEEVRIILDRLPEGVCDANH